MASKVAEAKWAYLAGLIDGEGCITIKAHNRPGGYLHYSPSLTIGMCTPVLKRLCTEYGIGLITFKPPGKDGWRDAFVWQFDREDTITVLTHTLPYLQVKGKQARLLIEFMTIHGCKQRGKNAERKQEIVRCLRDLNKRGA